MSDADKRAFTCESARAGIADMPWDIEVDGVWHNAWELFGSEVLDDLLERVEWLLSLSRETRKILEDLDK